MCTARLGSIPAQCGRTFIHVPHDTTEGPCPGLSGVEVAAPAAEDPWALPVPYAVLEGGLRILQDYAGGWCEHVVRGALGACFDQGRTPDAPYGAERACVPCIAHRVLQGLPLPSAYPTNTHRAVIEDALGHTMQVLAFGSEDHCRETLTAYLAGSAQMTECERGAILQVVDGGC